MYRDKRKRHKRTLKLSHNVEEIRLKKPRKGAVIRQESWVTIEGEVVKYSLAYINHRICNKDNGRVLGYDNSHGHHHRHYMGKETPMTFDSYEQLVEDFFAEIYTLWERENE